MTTTIERQELKSSKPIGKAPELASVGMAPASRLTTEHIWHVLRKASFAVVGYTTPTGEPRSTGVLYKVVGSRLYVAVEPGGWKARHIGLTGRVSMTVPVRRGGILSLALPIPPATVSFHGTAAVHRPGSAVVRRLTDELASLLPPERQHSSSIVEIIPEGVFVTYGLGVSLKEMRDTVLARARVPVRREGDER